MPASAARTETSPSRTPVTLTGGNGDAIILGNGNNTIQITAGQLNGVRPFAGTGNNSLRVERRRGVWRRRLRQRQQCVQPHRRDDHRRCDLGRGKRHGFALHRRHRDWARSTRGAGSNALTLDGSGNGHLCRRAQQLPDADETEHRIMDPDRLPGQREPVSSSTAGSWCCRARTARRRRRRCRRGSFKSVATRRLVLACAGFERRNACRRAPTI